MKNENKKYLPKKGTELIESFFQSLEKREDDKEVTSALVDLFKANKLSATHISNKLSELRDRNPHEVNDDQD